jgi:hypothetical protein
MFVLAIAVSALALSGCKCDADDPVGSCGTGTGNPIDDMGSKTPDGMIGTNELMHAVCNKMSACHTDLAWADCKEKFFARTDVDTEIGIPAGTYPTFLDTFKAELNYKIKYSPLDFNDCLSNLNSMTCDDPLIVNAYTSSAVDPMAGITAIFSPICADAFWIPAE